MHFFIIIGVRGFMEQFQIPRKNILIVSDDIRLIASGFSSSFFYDSLICFLYSLPLGRIRVRRSGSSGGQNGLGKYYYTKYINIDNIDNIFAAL